VTCNAIPRNDGTRIGKGVDVRSFNALVACSAVLALAAAAPSAWAGKGGGGGTATLTRGFTVVSPVFGSATTAYAPFVVTGRVTEASPWLAPVCSVDWGDWTWDSYPASLSSTTGVYYCSVVHAYTAPGTYIATITASDSAGAIGSSSVYAFVG
jgi:hypothetical protein